MCFCGLGFGAKAYGVCAGNTAEEVAIGSLLGDSLLDLIVAAAAAEAPTDPALQRRRKEST